MTARGVRTATATAFGVLLLAGALGVFIGSARIPLGHIAGILAGTVGLPVEPVWRPWEATVLLDVRLPRVLVGMLVGASLALTGTALQGLFRNPLADSGVIGVSAGASLGAVIAIHLGIAAKWIWALPGFAFIGAIGTAFAVYAIATRRGRTPVGTLLLAGVAVGSLNVSLISFVLALALANYEIGRQMIFWLMGGLDGRTWDHVRIAAPLILFGAAVVAAHARDLDALLLGEIHASAVGVDVPRIRRRLIAATSLVVGAAVAVSGSIGFVGLVVPHILRLLVGPSHRRLLPISIIAGAGFVVVGDIVARTLIAPEEIRLGVITAAVGAPFFVFLLVRRQEKVAA
ncbi:MAG: FecCD family ABC transporter permease [Gammaproteobacteria bacterium]